MRKQVFTFFLVLAFCFLVLLIEESQIWNPHSSAQTQDQAISLRVAPQQLDGRLSRHQQAEQRFQMLNEKVRLRGEVQVIVKIRVAFRPEFVPRRGTVIQSQRFAINQRRDMVLGELTNYDRASIKRFNDLPFLAIKVNRSVLETLRLSSNVDDIFEDELLSLSLAESVPLVGAPAAWANGFTGAGRTVAILDTGVDKYHQFLSGKVLSEACYSTNNTNNGASSLCPGGVPESVSFDSGLNCTGINGCDHGTHVAGIAAGTGGSFSGVAKDASIISIQVFSRFDNLGSCGGATPCIRAFTSDIMRGLERVYALRDSFNIAAVNLSLGGGRFMGNCDSHPLKGIIDQLASVGIATVIASGNEGYADAIGSPACISSAISVGATGDGTRLSGDNVAPYSNSSSVLSLLAPGDSIVSSVPGGGFATFFGTSMASPHVAGAWAILKQQFPTASVSDILNELRTYGVRITDQRNGITISRINLNRSDPCLACTAGFSNVTPVSGDFDGDGKGDVAFWNGQTGEWRIRYSSNGSTVSLSYGTALAPHFDVPVPQDYDGDGRTDVAIWRRSGPVGVWWARTAGSGFTDQSVFAFGDSRGVPVVGDYDGDRRADLAVWNGETGEWKINYSSNGSTVSLFYGTSAAPHFDIPVPQDYDGDGRTDIAIWRRSGPVGVWWVRTAGSGFSDQSIVAFGDSRAVPVASDYDGDRRADYAVWYGEISEWNINYSSNGSSVSLYYGTSLAPFFDVPVPQDYDGDKRTDIAVSRRSSSFVRWFIRSAIEMIVDV